MLAEFPAPYARRGDTAEVVARGPCHWATNADAPRRGYFAGVRVSGRSADDAQVPTLHRVYGSTGATPVRSVGAPRD